MVEIAPGTTVQIIQPGLVVPLGVVKGDKGDPGPALPADQMALLVPRTEGAVLDSDGALEVNGTKLTSAALRTAPAELMPAFIKGDSYAQGGGGADNGTRFMDRVFSRLRTLTPANTGVSGTTSVQILNNQVTSAWTPNTRGIVGLADVVLNDARLNYSTATTAEAFRSILTYLSSWYVGSLSDTAIEFGPGWTNGTSSTTGSYVDVSFQGDAVDLTFSYGSTGGTATVTRSGTGSTAATVTTSGYSGTFNGTVHLSGFGAGSHTVRITTTSGTVTFAGYAIASPTPPTIVWFKPGAVTYTGDTGPGMAANRAAQLAACEPVAALFSNVLSVAAGSGWDTATMLAPDLIHPNDRGHAYIADQIEAALRTSLAWRQGLNQLTAAGAGTYSPTAPAYTTGSATAPSAPTGVTATAAAQVTVAWTRASDGGATITGQPIQASSDSGTTWTTVATAGPTASSYTVQSGLTQGTSYVFRVGATNAVGTTYSTASAAATAGAPIVTYSADTFTRADGALGSTETGSYAWTVQKGSALIASNRMSYTPGAGTSPDPDAYVDDGQANGTISVTFATNAGLYGLVFNLAGTNNATGYIAWVNASKQWQVSKRTASNTYTTLANPGTITAATNDTVSVIKNGSSITVKVNGTTLWSGTDASYTGTRHGVWIGNNNGSPVLADDFRHTSAVS